MCLPETHGDVQRPRQGQRPLPPKPLWTECRPAHPEAGLAGRWQGTAQLTHSAWLPGAQTDSAGLLSAPIPVAGEAASHPLTLLRPLQPKGRCLGPRPLPGSETQEANSSPSGRMRSLSQKLALVRAWMEEGDGLAHQTVLGSNPSSPAH